MTMWWRARGYSGFIVVALLTWLMVATTGNTAIGLPNLRVAGSFPVPIALVAPLSTSVAAMRCVGREADWERGTVRVLWLRDGLILYLWPFTLAIAGVGTAAAARNAFGYLGLSLAAASFVDASRASVITVAYVLVCSTLGVAPDGHPEPWAWVLADADSAPSWIAATICAVVGALGLWARSWRHLSGSSRATSYDRGS